MNTPEENVTFASLGLDPNIERAVSELGYEAPSQIQAGSIPVLLSGRDLLGQAQTGTGKTAAFALPLLSRLDLKQQSPQVLVLTPTRELALQVAEAFSAYGRHLRGFHILPVYGGQGMSQQLRALSRGVHVVVGTPGRVLDHLRRRTFKTEHIRTLVLDEADEMLRMGFAEDLSEILKSLPAERQTALFSATMETGVRKIAEKHLKDPVSVQIKAGTATVATVEQSYWITTGAHKLDALTRILEAEEFDAVLVFVRTKNASVDLAEKLEARGFASDALNGDMTQAAREKTVSRLKSGSLDVVVATDVAARGLDVKRISHVINYDMPYDTESYVHRIGRTARAGRDGRAILFVAPRERRMLATIERATRQTIAEFRLPSRADIAERQLQRFKERITTAIGQTNELADLRPILSEYQTQQGVEWPDLAAALAILAMENQPTAGTKSTGRFAESAPESKFARERPGRENEGRKSSYGRDRERPPRERPSRDRQDRDRGDRDRQDRGGRERSERSHTGSDDREYKRPERFEKERPARSPRSEQDERPKPPRISTPKDEAPTAGRPHSTDHEVLMVRYRIEVGQEDGVEARNIVGAIANEAGLDARYIENVRVDQTFSTLDLPEGMPREIMQHLKKVRVGQKPLRLQIADPSARVRSAKPGTDPAKKRPIRILGKDTRPPGKRPGKPDARGAAGKGAFGKKPGARPGPAGGRSASGKPGFGKPGFGKRASGAPPGKRPPGRPPGKAPFGKRPPGGPGKKPPGRKPPG